jgi:hypothetical protein
MLVDEVEADAENRAIFTDIRAYCSGRMHNIWGSDRNEDCPCVLLRYDIAAWMRSSLSMPLSQFELSVPLMYKFGFSDAKMEEMAAQIERYGTTATGIGRIIVQMGRDRIWREPVVVPTMVTSAAVSSRLQEVAHGVQS